MPMKPTDTIPILIIAITPYFSAFCVSISFPTFHRFYRIYRILLLILSFCSAVLTPQRNPGTVARKGKSIMRLAAVGGNAPGRPQDRQRVNGGIHSQDATRGKLDAGTGQKI